MQNEAAYAALKNIASKTFCAKAMQNSNTTERYKVQTLCIL
jgi:hypothetical protein